MSHTYVFEEEPGRSEGLANGLREAGYSATRVGSPAEVESALRRGGPSVLVVVEPQGGWSTTTSAVCGVASRCGVPSLVISDPDTDPEKLAEADDCIAPGSAPKELAGRVARLLARRSRAARMRRGDDRPPQPPWNGRFLAMVVHDLRTPLHVIGLSLRMIQQAIPQGDPDLDEDVRFLEENYRRIERMLTQLSDFNRLSEQGPEFDPVAFDPRALVAEVVESRPIKPWRRHGPVDLEVDPSCPAQVRLDPLRAKLAIHYALVNTAAAADGRPVRVTLRGEPGRWLTELTVEQPPPPSVEAVALQSQDFKRLCGSSTERRGLDLAIAAMVTESFGGTARLDVDRDSRTLVILDWPVRIGED